MRLLRVTFIAVAAQAFLAAPIVGAAVIYNTGAPLLDTNDANYLLSDYAAPRMQGQAFTVGGLSAEVQEVVWYGEYFNTVVSGVGPADDNFTITYHDFSGSSPAASGTSLGIATLTREFIGVDFFGGLAYKYTATLSSSPDNSLASGGYLLSIVNDTGTQDNDWYWLATAPVPTTPRYHRTSDTNGWTANQDTLRLAFELRGTVVHDIPIPSTVVLLIAGLVPVLRRGTRSKLR